MKASEFIKKLQSIVEQHGDLDVLAKGWGNDLPYLVPSMCEVVEMTDESMSEDEILMDECDKSSARKHIRVGTEW